MKKYIIEDDFIKLTLTDYGARIIKLIIKPLDRNVVLGYENLEDYKQDQNFFGATIGPNANRIKDGKFLLEEKSYCWDRNDGSNNLHSGIYGLDKKLWTLSSHKRDSIEFKISNKEPFKYEASVNYTLNSNGVNIKIKARGEETCLFNFTNHSYFNLEKTNSIHKENYIHNHKIKLYSNKITPMDEKLIPLEIVKNTDLSAYDFNNKKLLGKMLAKLTNLSVINNGYDVNYVMDDIKFQRLADISVKDLEMIVYSDAPGFQFYTGGSIIINDENIPYLGLCIEPQNVPNSINSSIFIKPVYKKHDNFNRRIRYEFVIND